jgi:hypothetical protein
MIPPSYKSGNVRSWSDPVVVPSNPRGRTARAMHEIFFENLRNPACSRRAGLMRQFRSGQLDSTKFSTKGLGPEREVDRDVLSVSEESNREEFPIPNIEFLE